MCLGQVGRLFVQDFFVRILETDSWKFKRISQLVNRSNIPEKLALKAMQQGKDSCLTYSCML